MRSCIEKWSHLSVITIEICQELRSHLIFRLLLSDVYFVKHFNTKFHDDIWGVW